MKTLQFKTTINCGGCIATVSSVLNNNDKIQEWGVDVKNPDKILTITTDYNQDELKELLDTVGFKADSI